MPNCLCDKTENFNAVHKEAAAWARLAAHRPTRRWPAPHMDARVGHPGGRSEGPNTQGGCLTPNGGSKGQEAASGLHPSSAHGVAGAGPRSRRDTRRRVPALPCRGHRERGARKLWLSHRERPCKYTPCTRTTPGRTTSWNSGAAWGPTCWTGSTVTAWRQA